MKKLSFLSAVAYPCGVLGTVFLVLTSTTGCGALGMTYSLTGMTLQPQAGLTCIPPGAIAQYKAYGSFTEGGHMTKIEDISNQVTWTASLPELARIDSSGLATAATTYVGTTGIIATVKGEFGILTSSSDLKVSLTCVSSSLVGPRGFAIVPARQDLAVGEGLAPLAVVSDTAGGHTTSFSAQATWTSSDPNVAVVGAHGVIRAVGPGDAIVTAVAGRASATTAIHVNGDTQDQ